MQTASASLSGSLRAPITLTDAGRTLFAGAACSGDRGCVAVIHEPPGGWTAPLAASGLLLLGEAYPPAAIAVSGGTLVAGPVSSTAVNGGHAYAYVFLRPNRGWPTKGTLAAAARLLYRAGNFDSGPALAVSGTTIAAGHTDIYGTKGCVRDPTQPCRLTSPVDVFSRPPGGWAGTLAPQSVLAARGPQPIALGLDNHTVLAVAGDDTISATSASSPVRLRPGLSMPPGSPAAGRGSASPCEAPPTPRRSNR